MIRISVLYPNNQGTRFNMSYYLENHIPQSIQLLSAHAGFKGVTIERGISGAVSGSEPDYRVMCHFLFDTVEDFLAAFTPHAETLQGDIPNYTDIEPVIQISEVLLVQ